jgi:hypothetical protein
MIRVKFCCIVVMGIIPVVCLLLKLEIIFLRWDYLLFVHGVYGFILLAVVFIIAIYNILMGILIFCIFPY